TSELRPERTSALSPYTSLYRSPKAVSQRVPAGDRQLTVTGIAKGAGMIRPNMATMLGYIATDASVAEPLLSRWLHEIADASFNRSAEHTSELQSRENLVCHLQR